MRPIHIALAAILALPVVQSPARDARAAPELPAAGQDALPLMLAMEEARRSPGEVVDVRMDLAFGSGRAESRTFRMWTRTLDDGGGRMLMRFDSPPDLQGTALLMIRRPGGQTDNWVWLPSLGRSRRIAPADATDSFMQSEFTVEDLTVAVDPTRLSYTSLGEVPCGDGRSCIQVDERRATEQAIKESLYGRVVLYVDKDLFVVHRVDFYDKSGALMKVLQAGGLVRAGDGWRFDRVTVGNAQNGNVTTMQVVARRLDPKMDDSVFNPAQIGSL